MPKPKNKHRLRLSKLRLLSPVDTPAQETATARLTKGADGVRFSGEFRVAKADEKLGLVFGYAFTETKRGADYYDLHGDQVVCDDEMIKVALGFVEDGALADEMHDGIPTGSVPFVMPMTDDIAKAFGIEGAERGLMVGMKPAPAAFEKFLDGTYTGFSLDGLGVREAVEDATQKRAQLTDDVAGHAHLVYDDQEQAGETSWSHAEGSDGGHSHPWVRTMDGDLVIGASDGHTHTLVSVEKSRTSAVKCAAGCGAELDDRERGAGDSVNGGTACSKCLDPNSWRLQAGAAEHHHSPWSLTNSTQPPIPAAKAHNQEIQMDEKIKALEAELAIAKAFGRLNDEEKAYANGLDEAERADFITATKAKRAEVLKAAADADPVEYTAADGTEYRKSAGTALISLAKRADDAEKVAKAERAARADQELRKRAESDLRHLPGDLEHHVSLLKAVESIEDEDARNGALNALKAHAGRIAHAFKEAGTSLEGDTKAAEQKLHELTQKRADEKGEAFGVAFRAVIKTDEGAALYNEARSE
jgi:hypothetical protein